MKLWKRTAAMLLCLGVSFSAFGCGDKGGKENSDNNPADSTPPASSENAGNVDFDKAENLADVLAAAKSAKVTVELNVTDADGDTAPIQLSGVFSQTETGVDVQLEADGETVYVIDGWGYTYYEEDGEGYYEKSGTNVFVELENQLAESGFSMAQIEGIFAELAESLGDMEGAEDVLGSLGEEFEASAKLEDGAMVVTLDCAPAFNAVLDYLTTLTPETTLESVVNDILGLIDPELTAAGVLDQVATLGAMTVSEAYETLNDIVIEETNYSIQSLKQMLIMNEDVKAMLLENGMTEAEIEQIYAINIEKEIEPYGDWSLNELIRVLVNDMNAGSGTAPDQELGEEGSGTHEIPEQADEIPEGTDIVGMVAEEVKAYLQATTLADFEVEIGAEGFVETLQSIGALEVKQAEVKYGVKYDKEMKIDSLLLGLAFNVANEIDGIEETVALDLKVTISEISAQPVVIALPEGATVVTCCANCGFNSIDDNTIAYDEELGGYYCADCKESMRIVCVLCGDRGVPMTYYPEYDGYVCDSCEFYMNNETVSGCVFCGNEEANYYPEYEVYFCDACYAEFMEGAY